MSIEGRNLVLTYACLATVALGIAASTGGSAGASAPQLAAAVSRCDTRKPISSLPYDITTPGSYYVTRDLTGVSGYGIGIAADDVTLDLGGYTLRGAGGSEGIVVFNPQENVTIHDGIVRGWTATGISAGNVTNGRLQNLTAEGNGGSGILAGFNQNVSDCTASSNGSIGIAARTGSVVVNCGARSNLIGFSSLAPAHGMLIQGCTASSNTADGIVLSGSRGCTLLDNQCFENVDRGIQIDGGFGNRIDSNNCVSNAVGLDVASGSNHVVIRNSCRINSSSNYAGAAGDIGPIGTAASSTSPWANL